MPGAGLAILLGSPKENASKSMGILDEIYGDSRSAKSAVFMKFSENGEI